MASTSAVDGIYSAYFTGVHGNSIAMFVFKDRLITGADVGGGLYEGHFDLTEDGKNIDARITFTLTIGGQSITGASAADEPVRVEVPLRLPGEINKEDTFRIETPIGPINAKFQKLRTL